MKKIAFIIFSWLIAFSTAFGDEFKSIKQFNYKGISFASTMDDLKAHGFNCQDKTCVIGDEFFKYKSPGLFSITQLARDGKTVTFHENHVIKITIDQLYPYMGEGCQNIMNDLQTRFNDKYKADIKFHTYASRAGPVTDYGNLMGAIKLGEDILRVHFSCSEVKKPDTEEMLTFIHALFHYENLASRLLVDDI